MKSIGWIISFFVFIVSTEKVGATSFREVLSSNVLIAQPKAKQRLHKEIKILEEQEGLHILVLAGEDIDSQREAARILISSNTTHDSLWWSTGHGHGNLVTDLALKIRNDLTSHFNKKTLHQDQLLNKPGNDLDSENDNIHKGVLEVGGTGTVGRGGVRGGGEGSIASCGLIVVIDNAERLSADSLTLVLSPIHAAYEKSTKKLTPEKSLSRRATILNQEVEIPPKVLFVLLFDLNLSLDSNKPSLEQDEIDASKVREALPRKLRKVIFRYTSIIIPFNNPNAYWRSMAMNLLQKRRHSTATSLISSPSKQIDGGQTDKDSAFLSNSHEKGKKPNKLSDLFKGQSRAVSKIDKELSNHLGDFAFDDGSPLVIALMGPSGVGKTELSRQIARLIHGSQKSVEELEKEGLLLRFAMNQFVTEASITNLIGADRGNVGQCEGSLTTGLRRHQNAVVILDEFEKAHVSFANNLFLNAFGAHGFLTDSCSDNERVSTSQATFIITSNFASDLLILPDFVLHSPKHDSSILNFENKESIDIKNVEYEYAADRADLLFEHALTSSEFDNEGRRNPFKRSETRGRVDVFANLYPYHYTELYHVVESALYKAIQPFEVKYPTLVICWSSEAIKEFCSRYSSKEGLRPVVNSLGEISRLLTEANENKLLDLRNPSKEKHNIKTVALFATRYIDSKLFDVPLSYQGLMTEIDQSASLSTKGSLKPLNLMLKVVEIEGDLELASLTYRGTSGHEGDDAHEDGKSTSNAIHAVASSKSSSSSSSAAAASQPLQESEKLVALNRENTPSFMKKLNTWIDSLSSYFMLSEVSMLSAVVFFFSFLVMFYSASHLLLMVKTSISLFSFLFSSSFLLLFLTSFGLAAWFNLLPSYFKLLEMLKKVVIVLWNYPKEIIFIFIIYSVYKLIRSSNFVSNVSRTEIKPKIEDKKTESSKSKSAASSIPSHNATTSKTDTVEEKGGFVSNTCRFRQEEECAELKRQLQITNELLKTAHIKIEELTKELNALKSKKRQTL